MSITEFSPSKHRLKVAFFGVAPDDEADRAFDERRYKVVQCTDAQLRDPRFLLTTDSVVFFQNPDKPASIYHQLESHAKALLDYDCRIYVRVAKSEELQRTARVIVVNAIYELGLPGAGFTQDERSRIPHNVREREGVALAPYVYICDSAIKWSDLAQIVSENPAGESPNTKLEINVVSLDNQTVKLDAWERLLIQRAFSNCSTINLRQMAGGRSGCRAFRGHFKLSLPLLRRNFPLACFVKIGTRKQIEAEYLSQSGAAIFLPFYLTPKLDLKRSGLGADHGILVADFVDEAESLSNCAREGRAISVIGNLFNKTLRAWSNASEVQSTFSLSQMLEDLFPQKVPEHRQEKIIEIGAQLDLVELRVLFMSLKSRTVRVGWVHRDLHALNVLVRGSDALLIDFEKFRDRQPLVYDAATLEAGLLVDGFERDPRSIGQVQSSIESLYNLSVIIDWIAPCPPHDESAWFFDCVKKIRMHAREMECESGQYATALALALLKKGCNVVDYGEKQEELRALAYLFSERILRALSAREIDAHAAT